ncbi:MAG: deoxyguanosinetriphosphate triphosphohydrolase [Alphaproteobacteria bacterium]|nr:deoxyguanosinetriphosphate triphosphohydrolase [Alphaproteobacteria bacterium]
MDGAAAVYATKASESRGRQHNEPESRRRTPFQRDRDRIIHATAFRRLKHKTQVFIAPEGDHFRTRLTHSLEVSQIARSLSRALGLDEDLTEALALAHDFGHPPFGHAGEDALDRAMASFGGFDHNDQTLRVLHRLENRYPNFDGLNLTWETLEGVVKHNGPLRGPYSDGKPIPPSIAALDREFPLDLDTFPGPEAQVAAIADDIAYNNHDLDDGFRAGIFVISDLAGVPHVADVFEAVRAQYPAVAETRVVHEAVRRLIGEMVEDVIAETLQRLVAAQPSNAPEIRQLDHPVVAFSPAMSEKERALKALLYSRMYRHDAVVAETDRAREIVAELFSYLVNEPRYLPEEWRRETVQPDTEGTARIVCDYIAGMTDQFALRLHRRIVEGKF